MATVIVRARSEAEMPVVTPSVLGHEVDGLRRRHLRRHHQVALVLALFVVD